jgi:hypothetical protein
VGHMKRLPSVSWHLPKLIFLIKKFISLKWKTKRIDITIGFELLPQRAFLNWNWRLYFTKIFNFDVGYLTGTASSYPMTGRAHIFCSYFDAGLLTWTASSYHMTGRACIFCSYFDAGPLTWTASSYHMTGRAYIFCSYPMVKYEN